MTELPGQQCCPLLKRQLGSAGDGLSCPRSGVVQRCEASMIRPIQGPTVGRGVDAVREQVGAQRGGDRKRRTAVRVADSAVRCRHRLRRPHYACGRDTGAAHRLLSDSTARAQMAMVGAAVDGLMMVPHISPSQGKSSASSVPTACA